MRSDTVLVSLEVLKEGRATLAKLTFVNIAEMPFPLYVPNLPQNRVLLKNVFLITSGAQRVVYLGPRVKRCKPKLEDFVMLEPGKTLCYDAILDTAYDIENTMSPRQIRYEAYHGDMALWGNIVELRSEDIIF